MVRRDTLTRGLLQGSPNGSRLEPVRFFAPPRIARSRSRSGRRRPREPARSVLLRAIDIGGLVKLTPQPRANGGLLWVGERVRLGTTARQTSGRRCRARRALGRGARNRHLSDARLLDAIGRPLTMRTQVLIQPPSTTRVCPVT